MVLEYATDGNLREYLEINFPNSGNILHFDYYAKITDLGLAQSSKHDSNSNVSGVLPYIAPEVLDGKPYTFASDIYSFGIIMVEISTGKSPYGSVPHDEKLALAICNGLRPRVVEEIRNWRFYDDHEKLS